jgi:hypothetical protein
LPVSVCAKEEGREVVRLLLQDEVVFVLGSVVLLELHVPGSFPKPQVNVVGMPCQSVGSLLEAVAHLLAGVLGICGKNSPYKEEESQKR